ncbi:MAG TPA: hypothetical protein VKD19_00110 [Pseudolabrys sp.]|nr:hypothetical protein [Pseudolabrys sp.]
MRAILIAALSAILVLDIGYAFLVGKYEKNAHHESAKKNDEQRPIEGPFIIGTKVALLHFLDFAERNESAITALSTLGIFAFTVILAIATYQLKGIGDRQVQALTDLERPWLFMEKARVERREGPPINPRLFNNWYISFYWRNVGRAPALIEECTVKIESTDMLPNIPDYANASQLICPSTVAKDIEFETNQIGPADPKRTKDGKAVNLTVYGRLTYKGLGGNLHHTGFAVDVSPHLPAFSTHAKNKKYEYYD